MNSFTLFYLFYLFCVRVGAREGKIAQEDYIRQETGHPSFQSMIGKFEDTFDLQVRHYTSIYYYFLLRRFLPKEA